MEEVGGGEEGERQNQSQSQRRRRRRRGETGGEEAAEGMAGGEEAVFEGAIPIYTTVDMAPYLNDFRFPQAGPDSPHGAKGPIPYHYTSRF